MAFKLLQNSFIAGELSPQLYGRTDIGKWHNGASTCRNFFVNYRGGAASRAGTAYIGRCKQAGSAAPPRDIPFQFSNTQGFGLEFGDLYMRVKSRGAYVLESAQGITGATVASPAVITVPSHGYSVGDWLYIADMRGMTEFNGLTWIIQSVPTANTFTLTDLFGQQVDSILFPAYTGGGTVARVYTLATPYAAVDLPYLKYTQSADTMTLCCVNTSTSVEYPSYELVRHSSANWSLTADSFSASIAAPGGVSVAAHASTAVSTWYSYVVTAVDAVTGEESIASAVGSVENNDIAVFAGSNTISWTAVAGASSYNVFKATPSYAVGVPVGAQFGFMGTAFATSFTDTNIVADFTRTPPLHRDPFARGAVLYVGVTGGGGGYTQATIGYTITTATGSGFVGTPVVDGAGAFVAFIVQNGGKNYGAGDTIAITDGGGGAGATASLALGPQTGTYPACPAYFQQRRVYADSLNDPDTYWMSRTGLFNNMDASIPTIDSDAITGAPWAQQVNGIQFLVPMPGGLVVLTGKGAWQLNGGTASAITPANQTAVPQAYNGCSDIVPPIVANYDILYVQAKGSIVRDLSYNFFVNIYTGTDMTVLSNHLFANHTILQWAYAEEPYKLVWCVRDDGILLCLTYLKEQDVYAWSRHDTDGAFVSVCSITEPPSNHGGQSGTNLTDAVYLIAKRYVQGAWYYFAERMDDRDWEGNVEQAWCLDAGLAYPMPTPAATIMPQAAEGTNNITAVAIVSGGTGYTAPQISATDPFGQGTGATFHATVIAGVITAIAVTAGGQNYPAGCTLRISDATGSGAIAQPIVTNYATFVASANVFTSANVGDVIRAGGGKATIVQYISPTQVVANITQAITSIVPDDPGNMPAPQQSGFWTMTTPTTTVSGLNHLEGMTVSILADGSVVAPQVVTNGTVTLPVAASAITVGLGFTAQLQTMYLDPPGPDAAQSRRKDISGVAVRCEASRGFSIGTNQPDASTQPNGRAPPWTGMLPVKERNATITAGTAIPLFTGDAYEPVTADWDTKAQVAIETSYPLPVNALAVVTYYQMGDTSA